MLGESGRGGAGAVSTGRGDHGGVSYGLYQFASNMGVPAKFLKTEGAKYAGRFAGQKQGTPQFSQTWSTIAREDPDGFGTAQQAYAERVYFRPQAARIKKATGIDLADRSFALQEAVFSSSIQLGENNPYVEQAIKGAIKAKGPQVTDRDLIEAIYAERGREDGRGGLAHFPSSKDNVKGLRRRFADEKQKVLGILQE